MHIGLFFGSFNPIHIGHLIIGDHILNETNIDQVWYVVSPHNPLKQKKSLANDYERLHMVRLAIEGHGHMRASNIEFDLPQPSYTINTLTYLKEKHPEYTFSMIMGGDNLFSLPKWKNYGLILERYQIYVYNRSGHLHAPLENHANVHMVEAPLLNISASFIRKSLKGGKSIRYLVHHNVFEYLESTNLYRS